MHSVLDRLRQLEEQGEIALVDDGATVITQAQAQTFTARIQNLSDQISGLEATLANQLSQGQTDLPQLMQDIRETRRKLSQIYSVFLKTDD